MSEDHALRKQNRLARRDTGPVSSPAASLPLLLSLAGLAFISCNSGGSPSAPTSQTAVPGATSAAITLSMTPNPVVEDPTCLCGGLPNRVAAIGRLTIRETQGVGVRIDGLRVSAQHDASARVTFTAEFTPADLAGHANGQNRVPANGSLEVVDVGGHYDRSLSGAATMRIDVRGTDDRGNAVTASLTVAIR